MKYFTVDMDSDD